MTGDLLLPKDMSKCFLQNLEFARYAESLRRTTLVPTLTGLYIHRAITLMAYEALMEEGS